MLEDKSPSGGAALLLAGFGRLASAARIALSVKRSRRLARSCARGGISQGKERSSEPIGGRPNGTLSRPAASESPSRG